MVYSDKNISITFFWGTAIYYFFSLGLMCLVMPMKTMKRYCKKKIMWTSKISKMKFIA